MTKLRDYHEFSDKIETFCGRPQVAPTNKFENQQLDKSKFEALEAPVGVSRALVYLAEGFEEVGLCTVAVSHDGSHQVQESNTGDGSE